MAFKKTLANFLMYPVPAGPGAGDISFEVGKPGLEAIDAAKETKNSPVFANYKAVSFPSLVAAIGGAWAGLQQLGTPFLTSRWVPFVLCMGLGGFLTWLELSEDQVTPRDRKAFGGMVGLCNCLVLFSAVVGGARCSRAATRLQQPRPRRPRRPRPRPRPRTPARLRPRP